MATTITASYLEKHLTDVLGRVHEFGEHFIIERDGETVAELSPKEAPKGITLEEFVKRMRGVPRPDDAFADDLEAVQASQQPASFPDWPG